MFSRSSPGLKSGVIRSSGLQLWVFVVTVIHTKGSVDPTDLCFRSLLCPGLKSGVIRSSGLRLWVFVVTVIHTKELVDPTDLCFLISVMPGLKSGVIRSSTLRLWMFVVIVIHTKGSVDPTDLCFLITVMPRIEIRGYKMIEPTALNVRRNRNSNERIGRSFGSLFSDHCYPQRIEIRGMRSSSLRLHYIIAHSAPVIFLQLYKLRLRSSVCLAVLFYESSILAILICTRND